MLVVGYCWFAFQIASAPWSFLAAKANGVSFFLPGHGKTESRPLIPPCIPMHTPNAAGVRRRFVYLRERDAEHGTAGLAGTNGHAPAVRAHQVVHDVESRA